MVTPQFTGLGRTAEHADLAERLRLPDGSIVDPSAAGRTGWFMSDAEIIRMVAQSEKETCRAVTLPCAPGGIDRGKDPLGFRLTDFNGGRKYNGPEPPPPPPAPEPTPDVVAAGILVDIEQAKRDAEWKAREMRETLNKYLKGAKIVGGVVMFSVATKRLCDSYCLLKNGSDTLRHLTNMMAQVEALLRTPNLPAVTLIAVTGIGDRVHFLRAKVETHEKVTGTARAVGAAAGMAAGIGTVVSAVATRGKTLEYAQKTAFVGGAVYMTAEIATALADWFADHGRKVEVLLGHLRNVQKEVADLKVPIARQTLSREEASDAMGDVINDLMMELEED